MSEHFYLTNVDIHLLCKHFKIALITISSKNSILKENGKKMFAINYFPDSVTHFYIIKQYAIQQNEPLVYELIHLNGQPRFRGVHFPEDYKEEITNNIITTPFSKQRKRTVKKKKGYTIKTPAPLSDESE